MKIDVCEICFYQGKKSKLVLSKYNIAKKSQTTKFKLSVCEEHKDFLKNTKTIKELDEEYLEMVQKHYREGGK